MELSALAGSVMKRASSDDGDVTVSTGVRRQE